MPILKYTTSIDSEKTILEIQKNLSSHGAKAVLSEYDDDGNIISLSFRFRLNDNDMAVRLPMNKDAILTILERSSSVPRKLKTEEQAIRVGWRIIKAWIDAQMAIYETKMVKMEQIFLPYMVTPNGMTFFEQLENNQFALPEPPK